MLRRPRWIFDWRQLGIVGNVARATCAVARFKQRIQQHGFPRNRIARNVHDHVAKRVVGELAVKVVQIDVLEVAPEQVVRRVRDEVLQNQLVLEEPLVARRAQVVVLVERALLLHELPAVDKRQPVALVQEGNAPCAVADKKVPAVDH